MVADESGSVYWVQPSWSAFTGQEPERAAGHGWLHSIDPRDRAQVAEHWVQQCVEGEPFTLAAGVWHAPSRAFRPCRGPVVPIRDDGAATHWVASLSEDHHDEHTRDFERTMAARFHRIFAANVFGIAYGEHDQIVDGNDAFLDTIGSTRSHLTAGIRLGRLFDTADFALDTFTNGSAREYEITRLDGTPAHVLAAGVSLTPDPGWLAFTVDLTPRKAAERAMAYLALHDPLTGLPNRRLLEDRLQHALAGAHRSNGGIAVLYCDIDHFKRINDSYGHRGGDTVLQTVARRLETVVRENDTVARAGGDEFVVVLGDLGDPTEATRIAERARVVLSQPIPLDTAEVRITASLGVALHAGPKDDVETLLRVADNAMYEAKTRGRDQVAFADDELSRGA